MDERARVREAWALSQLSLVIHLVALAASSASRGRLARVVAAVAE